MEGRREVFAFCASLAVCVSAFFYETLFLGKVLSPADVLFVSASFRGEAVAAYEPANRLLMDPVLQFQPWLEFNRRMIRSGRLPLWNSSAGCGAPHLANGQSAVFDPFNLLAYLGSGFRSPSPGWPHAGCGWRGWGCSCWLARGGWEPGGAGSPDWFIRSAASWSSGCSTRSPPWRSGCPGSCWRPTGSFATPNASAAGWLAVVVALIVLGGHIQTSAHVLLAGGLYALARTARQPGKPWARRRPGGLLGARRLPGPGSRKRADPAAGRPTWRRAPSGAHASARRAAWWKLARPRLLDMACTAVPYVYGSQRRGQPNLAKALGVNNLNESAGGFAGLATLLWLAPLAVVTRGRSFHVAFLAGLGLFGVMGAFRLPPVDNLLRALPVLEVTDNRRLTLWVSFALVAARRDRPRPAWRVDPACRAPGS